VSEVSGDLDRIESGPCLLTVGGISVGHTLGGVKLSQKLDVRKRTVDEYGSARAELIYMGEEIEIKTTIAESTNAALRLVYQWGYETTTDRQAWGRRPGRAGRSLAAELVIRPLSSVGDSSNDVVFYAMSVVSIDELVLGSVTADRTFGVTFGALVDPAQPGGLIGEIRVGAADEPNGNFLLGGGDRLLLSTGDALLLGD